MRFASLLAAAALFAAPSLAGAQAVVNGGFNGPEAAPPPGWTSSSTTGSILVFQEADYQACCGFTAVDPANSLATFGAGQVTNSGALSQVVALAAGSYSLLFDAGTIGSGTQSITASLFDDATNALLGSTIVATPGTTAFATAINSYRINFTALGATRIEFAADAGTINYDGIVDNVAIAVPEPATWAMLIGGIGLMGGTLRRRARRVATLGHA